jgi:uncharacterized repeat protein (TIGR03803 family)
MNTDGSGFALLHAFTGGDGHAPIGPLAASGSALYGMTLGGGGVESTLYKINTDGTGFEVLHYFHGGLDNGANPVSGLTVSGSKIYGTAFQGAANNLGAVFEINTDGTGFALLHSFAGGPSDGAYPYGGLTLSGSTLYGTAMNGGAYYNGPTGGGVLFALTVPEPSSIVLGGLGLMTLVAWRLRRQPLAARAYQ